MTVELHRLRESLDEVRSLLESAEGARQGRHRLEVIAGPWRPKHRAAVINGTGQPLHPAIRFEDGSWYRDGVEGDGAHDQRRSVAEPGKFLGAPAGLIYGRAHNADQRAGFLDDEKARLPRRLDCCFA